MMCEAVLDAWWGRWTARRAYHWGTSTSYYDDDPGYPGKEGSMSGEERAVKACLDGGGCC